jgi:hypothetical protein
MQSKISYLVHSTFLDMGTTTANSNEVHDEVNERIN